jgi:hypothetical protein
MTTGESVDELIVEDGSQSAIKLSPLAKVYNSDRISSSK